MQSAFGIIIFVVVAVAAVVAVVSLVNRGQLYDQIGRGGLSMDRDSQAGRPVPPAGSAAARAEAEEEVRQMVRARSERQARQGKPALDVEAEVARLMGRGTDPTSPAAAVEGAAVTTVDPELAAEVRQLVLARNARRAGQGKPELDVEAEVARELRELGG